MLRPKIVCCFSAILVFSACTSDVSGPNRAPVAVAGPDRSSAVDLEVLLDASGSFDPDGDELSYEWSLLHEAAPGAADWRHERGQATARLVPEAPGLYLAGLRVSDGVLASERSVLRITVSSTCETDLDCEDHNPCTEDSCEDSRCRFEALDDGSSCGPVYCLELELRQAVCAAGACTEDALVQDCDEGNPCTVNACDAEFGCQSANRALGYACGTCQVCDGNGLCSDDLERDGDCPLCQQCASGGRCENQASGLDVKGECSDGMYCNGLESCDGAGACADGAYPCGSLSCDEENDQCYGCAADTDCPLCQICGEGEICIHQTAGQDIKDDCAVDVCATGDCDGAGNCQFLGAEVLCREAEDPECDVAEHCDGTGPSCPQDVVIGVGVACSPDEHDCTADVCDGNGSCGHPLLSSESICRDSEDPVCDPVERCDGVNPDCPPDAVASPSEPCVSDGAECTLDFCDGFGACVHTPDHGACQGEALCVPACSVDGSGCATPPSAMSLLCSPDRVELQSSDSSDCVLELGLGGQTACLSCGAELGATVLARTGFDDCDLGGWQLVEGQPATGCMDALQDCVESGSAQDCCDEIEAICVQIDGNHLLQSDKATNCGTKKEEWRLWREFDLTGFHQIQVCAWVGHVNMDDKQTIAFYAKNLDPVGSEEREQFMCSNRDGGVPFPMIGGVLEPRCALLPAWAENNGRVRLEVVAHSENAGRRVYLDDLSVRAFRIACAPSVSQAFVADFEACAEQGLSAIPDGWNGWSVEAGDTGAHPKCPGTACSGSAAATVEVDDDWMNLQREVDTGALGGEVRLCFTFADDGAHAASSFKVLFDAGAGLSEAFVQTGDLGTDQACREICVNLSDLDPAVARNPALIIRFEVNADGGKIYIQNIRLEGIVACDAGADMSLSALADEGAGSYSFTATDAALAVFDVDLVCAWGDPAQDPILLAADTVSFRNPLPDWTHRRRIRFDNTGRNETLKDFPALIRLDASRVDYSLTDGGDLRFLDAALNPLAFEIETWDESGVSVIWVRVPSIAASSDLSSIWMYYGHPAAPDGQDPDAVWDRHFRGVYHLADEVGASVAQESSAYDFEGTYTHDSTPGELGMFGDGAVFLDGVDDRVALGGMDVLPFEGDNGLTLEFVGRLDENASLDDGRLISKSDGDNDGNHWWMLSTFDRDGDNYALRFRLKLDGTTYVRASSDRAITRGQWFYAVGTYDGARMRMFVNGQSLILLEDGLTGALSQDASKQVAIGANADGYRPLMGLVGEVRISNLARSQAWIAAQHQAMLDDVSAPFVLFGPEEAL